MTYRPATVQPIHLPPDFWPDLVWAWPYPPGGTYSQEVMADAPTLYWRLSDTSGTTAADASGSGLTGTYNGQCTLGVAGALAFDADYGVSLDGIGAYVSRPDTDQVDPGTSCTWEMWFKLDSQAFVERTLLSDSETNSNNGVWIFLTDAGLPSFWLDATDQGTIVVGSIPVYDGRWHHIACVFDNEMATLTMYVDGVADTSDTPGLLALSLSNTEPFVIGARSWGGTVSEYFPGSIDEVAFYPRPLSARRIRDHYAAGKRALQSHLGQQPILYQGSPDRYVLPPTAGPAGGMSSAFTMLFTLTNVASIPEAFAAAVQIVYDTREHTVGKGGVSFRVFSGIATWLESPRSGTDLSVTFSMTSVLSASTHLAITHTASKVVIYSEGRSFGGSSTPASWTQPYSVHLHENRGPGGTNVASYWTMRDGYLLGRALTQGEILRITQGLP